MKAGCFQDAFAELWKVKALLTDVYLHVTKVYFIEQKVYATFLWLQDLIFYLEKPYEVLMKKNLLCSFPE